jgi:formyl-CoA transferase
MGALAALHHRDRTGEGQVIDASIYESVLNVMEATIPEYTVSNFIRQRSGSTLPGIAPSNVYDCKDGSFVIAANQDTVFKRLCKTMGMPELAEDDRFKNHGARGVHMQELDDIIGRWASTRTAAELEELLSEAGVPAGRIYTAPDMLQDPHFKAREAIIDTPTEDWPNLKMQNVFPKMSKTQGEVRWTGPKELGAHNEEVYGELLGLSREELRVLQEKSIV